MFGKLGFYVQKKMLHGAYCSAQPSLLPVEISKTDPHRSVLNTLRVLANIAWKFAGGLALVCGRGLGCVGLGVRGRAAVGAAVLVLQECLATRLTASVVPNEEIELPLHVTQTTGR